MGSSKLNCKTRKEAISKIYSQAVNYHTESKGSQGNKYKRQIYSGVATNLQHLDSPGTFHMPELEIRVWRHPAFQITRFISTCIPAVPASGAGNLVFVQ